MDSEAKQLERKIIGVLIRAAREKARRTEKQVAQRLGVTPARVKQWERGAREVTFPELETLALFFNEPLSFFFEGTLTLQETIAAPPTPEQTKARRVALGAKLRQARLAAGKSKAECAAAIKRKLGTLARYERGAGDIPLTELDQLAQFLNINLYYFIERAASADEGGDLHELEKFARLPRETRAFVLEPENLPYLRMAAKFSDLPADKLKELGEIFLGVR